MSGGNPWIALTVIKIQELQLLESGHVSYQKLHALAKSVCIESPTSLVGRHLAFWTPLHNSPTDDRLSQILLHLQRYHGGQDNPIPVIADVNTTDNPNILTPELVRRLIESYQKKVSQSLRKSAKRINAVIYLDSDRLPEDIPSVKSIKSLWNRSIPGQGSMTALYRPLGSLSSSLPYPTAVWGEGLRDQYHISDDGLLYHLVPSPQIYRLANDAGNCNEVEITQWQIVRSLLPKLPPGLLGGNPPGLLGGNPPGLPRSSLRVSRLHTNKVVLVTGCLGGIGKDVCRYYRQQGWWVLGIDRVLRAQIIPKLDDHSLDWYSCLDLNHEGLKPMKTMLKSVHRRFGRLDALIHLAAQHQSSPFLSVDPLEWNRLVNVNLRSIYFLSQLATPLLKPTTNINPSKSSSASSTSIVTVSSIHAYQTSANISVYAMTKSALTGLTRNMALELAPMGIRVNCVCPGGVETPMLDAGIKRITDNPSETRTKEQIWQEFINRHPMKTVAQPADIASTIYFLTDSEKSGQILGQSLVVDGGVSMRLYTE